MWVGCGEGMARITDNALCCISNSRKLSLPGLWGFSDCFAMNSGICKTSLMLKIEKDKIPEKDDKQKHGTCPVDWLYYGYKVNICGHYFPYSMEVIKENFLCKIKDGLWLLASTYNNRSILLLPKLDYTREM